MPIPTIYLTLPFIKFLAPPSITTPLFIWHMRARRIKQRLADRIKQHVPMSIRKKSNTMIDSHLICVKTTILKFIVRLTGQHFITNPECAKTYTGDNFPMIGQARSSFHLSVLESVYIKTQNPVLRRQKEFVFSLGLFKQTMANRF